MNKLKLMIVSVFAVLGVGMAVIPAPAYAACQTGAQCIKDGVNASGGSSSKKSVGDLIKTVVNVLLFVLGAVAVIMIVIGGIKYTTSNGDSGQVSSAKNTILYAVVGLIVAIMAYAIVDFVVGKFV